MNEILLGILGLVGLLLSGVLGRVLGQRSERRKQSLAIRAKMLEPVTLWLGGVEKFIGILGDTFSSISVPSPVPLTYDFEERKKSSQFMIENTNEVLGILDSETLSIRQTRKEVRALKLHIMELDNRLKYELLPLEHEILDRARSQSIDEAFLRRVGETKLSMERQVRECYSLIAKIKTKYA